jgi:site-specific recombinase XerD
MTVTSLGLLHSSAGGRVCFPCVLGELMSQFNHAYEGRQQPKILDQVHYAIRAKHYSLRTEEVYVQWIRRFILFHNKRHPRDMGTVEVRQFQSDLAVNHHVAASTQNQALSAILFLYQHVLSRESW